MSDAQPPPGALLRPTGRVILVDGHTRVLLFRVIDGHAGGVPIWITPGGETGPDEDHAEAARRELSEEAGLDLEVDQLGLPVALTRGLFTWRGQDYWADDWYYFVRVDEFEVDTSGFTALEARVVDTYRWWTPAELERTDDIVYPVGLAGLVRRLARGDRPAEPIRLPWR
jgi:8-oxo-dGTP pyrophosphatase MutT (NUDIX family)